eukprot:1180808-Prorocentrum_minimum.AAC.2
MVLREEDRDEMDPRAWKNDVAVNLTGAENLLEGDALHAQVSPRFAGVQGVFRPDEQVGHGRVRHVRKEANSTVITTTRPTVPSSHPRETEYSTCCSVGVRNQLLGERWQADVRVHYGTVNGRASHGRCHCKTSWHAMVHPYICTGEHRGMCCRRSASKICVLCMV